VLVDAATVSTSSLSMLSRGSTTPRPDDDVVHAAAMDVDG